MLTLIWSRDRLTVSCFVKSHDHHEVADHKSTCQVSIALNMHETEDLYSSK